HRNSIIKKGEIAFQQQDLLDVYNAQLSQYGEIILKKRHSFFEEIKNTLITVYQNLQDNQEHLELKYTSTIQNDFYKELQHSLPKDIRMGYTTTGPHRDDFEILINNYPAKNFASQGQQKTIVFAIKFLELMYLHQKTKITPILLIDDLFDRLDDGRLNKIRLQIKNSPVTQIFLTDNHYERVNKLFEQESIEIIQI
ncbi:MAG: hypothetical protein N2203_01350, partial [Bacteroidia bacterium]|nr:hypothetical protein [Bacteroidia bacterium]